MDVSSGIPIHKTICLSPSQEVKTQARGTEWVKGSCNIKFDGSSVVECLNRDRGAAGSSLTGVTALWSLSKTHLS